MTDLREASPWANSRVRLVLTSACNINCFYCHNEGIAKSELFFPSGLFEHVVELVKLRTPHSVTFTGGEALLHPQLEAFASRMRLHCPAITVVTNGLLLTEARIGRLVNAGVSKVRLGVDSLFGKKSRPTAGMFPPIRIADVIEAILKSPLSLELNIVLTKFNISEIPKILRFCAARKISAKVFERVEVVRFGSIEAQGYLHTLPAISFDEFRLTLLDSGIALESSEPPEFMGANVIFQGEGFSWRYCRYLCPFGLCFMTGTRIDPEGAVYACMGKQVVETISESEPLGMSLAKVALVTKRRCREGAA